MRNGDSFDFGRMAVTLGILAREDLEKALRFQEDLRGVGVEKRLGEILLEKKILTRDQVLLVLRAQGKRILTCPNCKKSYNVHRHRPGRNYTCKHCGGALADPKPTSDTCVHDSIRIELTELKKVHKREAGVPPALTHLLPGYEILERLGQGGMGTVYKARDMILDRCVAVKLLAPFLAQDEEYVRRFFVEAKNLQRLHHPNIVQAYDAGVAGDHKFFLMEFVDGATLDGVLQKRGKLSERKALEIARQIAEALHYAWEHRIVHRDIKPQNVMVTHGRLIKLCDLGLSKDVTSNISLTMTGSINCTPPYASPEQAQGLRGLDTRSDVYSLGVMLFQMVTGELPFKGESPGEFIVQHVTKAPPNPLLKNPSLSPRTGQFILRMLAKDREDRPYPGLVAETLDGSLRRAEAARKPS